MRLALPTIIVILLYSLYSREGTIANSCLHHHQERPLHACPRRGDPNTCWSMANGMAGKESTTRWGKLQQDDCGGTSMLFQFPKPSNARINLGGQLILLKTLVIWSLGSSDVIQTIIKESYKRQRQDDDLNQPLSVQPWGRDGDKRRFWLIEGQDDTHFRLYRESNPALRHTTWRSVAGTIDEVKEVAHSLEDDNSLHSRRLKDRILAAIPRFEASEDV